LPNRKILKYHHIKRSIHDKVHRQPLSMTILDQLRLDTLRYDLTTIIVFDREAKLLRLHVIG